MYAPNKANATVSPSAFPYAHLHAVDLLLPGRVLEEVFHGQACYVRNDALNELLRKERTDSGKKDLHLKQSAENQGLACLVGREIQRAELQHHLFEGKNSHAVFVALRIDYSMVAAGLVIDHLCVGRRRQSSRQFFR